MSHSQNGIEIQTYCAIIACLLISLWTGRKPTIRTYEMIFFYLCGLASKDELTYHIEKAKRHELEIAVVLTVFFNYASLAVCAFGDGLESQHVQRRRLERKARKAARELEREGHAGPDGPSESS